MNYVTTNIRIPEEDYLRLKMEAARKRTSLSGIIREKVKVKKTREKSAEQLIRQIREHAAKNAKYFIGIDSVKIIRQIRDEAKW